MTVEGPAEDSTSTTEGQRPNIVFLVVDCLRNDFLNSEYADTPFLDSMTSRGTWYTNLSSTSAITTPCVASMMTGRYAEHNGVHTLEEVSLRDDIETLAERLSEGGYETHALATGPVVEDTGLDRGFDHFTYRERNKNLTNEWKETAYDYLDDLSEPFFFYLHLWELHWPIHVPEEFDSKKYGRDRYARMLSALDRELEEFVAQFPDNTHVIIHGDHGESVSYHYSPIHGHHNQLQKYSKKLRNELRYTRGYDTRPVEQILNRIFYKLDPDGLIDHFIERGHGETAYDFMTNVPLVITGPGIDGETVDSQTRQIDIYPTILHLAGIEYDPDIDGESLFPEETVEDRIAYIRANGPWLRSEQNWSKAVKADGMKYIEYPNREWESELYDLESDPAELYPINDDELKARYSEYILEDGHRSSENLEIEELLSDLGYL